MGHTQPRENAKNTQNTKKPIQKQTGSSQRKDAKTHRIKSKSTVICKTAHMCIPSCKSVVSNTT